jgi:hypothetical protein
MSTGSSPHYQITRKKKKRFASAPVSHQTGRDGEAVAKTRIKSEKDANSKGEPEQGNADVTGERGAAVRRESETGGDEKYQTPEKQM